MKGANLLFGDFGSESFYGGFGFVYIKLEQKIFVLNY